MCQTKICPQCGKVLFQDMDVCFECLHEFTSPELASNLPAAGFLIRLKTGSADVTIPLPPRGVVVGRGSACDIMLHDPSVSRQHVLVLPDEQGVTASDLGASNKALVRGEPVGEATHLAEGDELVVGRARLMVLPAKEQEATHT